jgi:hypothetical protein
MYTLQGKPDQHATRIPCSVRVWFQTICISHGQRIATFHLVINSDGQSHCSWEKELPTQSITRRLTDLWVCTQFLSQDSHWSSGGKATLCWRQGTRLTGPYHRYANSIFNTCSWGPTHQSLTNTGGVYNHLRALPGLRLSNLNIAWKVSEMVMWTICGQPVVFRPLNVYRSLYLCLAVANITQILARSSRVILEGNHNITMVPINS